MNITVHISQTKQHEKRTIGKGENILAVITRMRSSAIFKINKSMQSVPLSFYTWTEPTVYGAQNLELEIYEKKSEIFIYFY